MLVKLSDITQIRFRYINRPNNNDDDDDNAVHGRRCRKSQK